MPLDRKYISDIWLDAELPKHSYLGSIPAIKWLACGNRLSFSSGVTFLVGDNGTGKSTLIEATAVNYGFNPEVGTLNYSFSTTDTHSELCKYLTVAKKSRPKFGYFLRAETLYNVATYHREIYRSEISMGLREDLHNMSHGEFFLKILCDLPGNGLYIFDEPEAALSPSKLLSLMYLIHRLEKRNSQFIIATHSPILMAYPGAQIYCFSDTGIAKTDYRDTEHYQVTKTFLDCPEKTFGHLLED